MTVKFDNLIERITDWDNLLRAHRLARKGKRGREEVQAFEARLWENLGALQMELLWGTYRPGRYRSFVVYEPKVREILAAPYRDRVAQHAICAICGPYWDASMIADSYACRPGKGTHAGADRLQQWLRGMDRQGETWALKMDLSKYFASISHDLARRVIRRKIACARTLELLDAIIASTAGDDEEYPVGIPVGNLVSQHVANLVGNEIDQWAKRELRLRRYIRYMDDMVVLTTTKTEALALRHAFEVKIDTLGFRFSKASVLPINRGVNFLGYRIWPTHRLLRKDSIQRMRKTMRKLKKDYAAGRIGLDQVRPRIASWAAHAGHADSEALRKELLGGAVFKRSGDSDPDYE